MVNPDRRATVEEIAGHWWLNWGYPQPLLAEFKRTGQAPSQDSNSAQHPTGLSSIAGWFRRTSRPLLETGSKMRCLLRPQNAEGNIVRQRSLRRSQKENNVSHSGAEGTVDPRPKGILKRRPSMKQKLTGEVPTVEAAKPQNVSTMSTLDSTPSPALQPRKGILKKPTEQESGYCSTSPESGTSVQPPQTLELPAAPTSRKGILKRDGKFSSNRLQEFGSLDQLAVSLPRAGQRSRPSSAISEDSILSSESFDQLDLPERMGPSGPSDDPPRGSMRACVSADNLLDIQQSENLSDGLRRPWKCYQAGVADSAFSITDCENVTEAYKQAVVGRGVGAS